MSFFEKMKKASKGVVDAGAKQMLKVRCVFRCVAFSHFTLFAFLRLVRMWSLSTRYC
jgi:hypothetical protein